ncbi:flavin reductase family protein [Nocardiopsis sp. NPDC050513]|uniref:flavin reductase family protein n=1 Tax=Nocardiopsis sp. NPDC050513 TaxID=3364338 RepID=UPI00378B9904
MTSSTEFVDCMSMAPAVNLAGYGVGEALFKSVVGSLPTGVTVVTSLDGEGRPVGMTSGAVCGLSCSPPLLLTCIGRRSQTLRHLLGHGTFCVNVLGAGADRLSDRFAGRGPDRFAGVAWRPGPRGVPVLTEGVVAHAVCEVYEELGGGDHTIVVGLIVGGEHRPDAAPLLYHRRRYAGFPED